MTQELKVENPLGMYDGCWAKQRNGKIVGPWTWDGSGQRLPGWWCGSEHRHRDGRWETYSLGYNLDLIAVVPAPLPEPVEYYLLDNSDVIWGVDKVQTSAFKSTFRGRKLYRVRIEFLEEVTL